MYFLEESYKCKKFKFWNFWERPLYEISEYSFKGNPNLFLTGTPEYECTGLKQPSEHPKSQITRSIPFNNSDPDPDTMKYHDIINSPRKPPNSSANGHCTASQYSARRGNWTAVYTNQPNISS